MENSFNGVVFRLHGLFFAIDALNVREIVGGAEWKPLSVEGESESFLQVRGKAARVLDLRVPFGFPSATKDGLNSFVAVQAPGGDRNRLVALWVDMVLELVHLSADKLKAPPATAQEISTKYFRAAFDNNGETVFVLNVEKILEEVFPGDKELALENKAS